MASPSTKIGILSDVSDLLGNKTFTSLDEVGDFGTSLEAAYDLFIEAEIASGRWRFAAETEQLSLIGDLSPTFDKWLFEFQLPANFLSVQRIFPRVPYEVFGDRLYTTTNETLSLEFYSAAVNETVTVWSAPFKLYFVYLLAEHLSISTVENAGVIAKIEKGVMKYGALAGFVRSSNRPAIQMASQRYVTVRY